MCPFRTPAQKYLHLPTVRKLTRITIGFARRFRPGEIVRRSCLRSSMAWDAVNLRTDRGLPVSAADREIILSAAEKALLQSDQDPSIVIRAAERVSRKLDVIENLRAYASRAMSTALHRAARESRAKKSPQYASAIPKVFRISTSGMTSRNGFLSASCWNRSRHKIGKSC